jgi:hypothetical protein
VYCSDVATSVEEGDDLRATLDDLPITGEPKTAWYTILGAEITEPTLPGLYLRIMVTSRGERHLEKIVISER